jgi:hypothetical protein
MSNKKSYSVDEIRSMRNSVSETPLMKYTRSWFGFKRLVVIPSEPSVDYLPFEQLLNKSSQSLPRTLDFRSTNSRVYKSIVKLETLMEFIGREINHWSDF